MRKLLGLTIGGLQQKILNLVLVFLLAIIAVFGGVSYYQSKHLSKVVNEANEEQQESIKKVSENTMHQTVESSMTKTNALQAYIADEMFSEVKGDLETVRSLARDVFTNKDDFEAYPFELPDPSKEGEFSAQVLFEEGIDYKNSEYLPVAARMSGAMTAMCNNSSYMDNLYIGLADGTHISVDKHPANKFDENGKQIPFPVRERPWYKDAVAAGDTIFSGVEIDMYTGRVCVTCSSPVYVNNELVGVVGVDLFLDVMAEYVESSASSGGFICIIDNNGKVIFAPENNGAFGTSDEDKTKDLRESDNKELASFVTTALTESTGIKIIKINGKDYYLAATPLSTVGWTAVSGIEKSITEQPTEVMLSEYQRINDDASGKFTESTKRSEQITLVMIALLLMLGSTCALLLANKIVRPVEHMTNKIAEIGGTDTPFEVEDIYCTKDEIEVLANSFAEMSRKTKQYITDITKITKEKERIGTELELARRIQAHMLPNIYPAFPNRPEFDIYATMNPAKEVGGDFFDFFLIDDDHLGVLIADVSGKGVPAALFMMVSKILIHNYAAIGESPAKVLEQVNTTICNNIEEEMFVTVWLGVLEISTGKITAANAGHEYPIIRKPNGEYEIFKDKHSFVVGGMEGMKYSEYEFTLEKGATLFLYTDGVPEATNAEGKMLGMDKLIEIMSKYPNDAPKDLLTNVKASIDEFVGNADQFDDLTMLSLSLL